MTHVTLSNVGVAFKLYQPPSRSLKRVVLRTAVGGAFGQSGDGDYVVVNALDGIDLELRAGDKLGIVGHNGAGKTTLLRVMAGIYFPTSGEVSSQGHRVPLFDVHSGFDDEATGFENIFLRGMLMGFKREALEKRVDEIAAFSELGKYLELPVRTYSSGMLLRLLFSISTSIDADILLMDEWVATGDQDFRQKANQRLRDLVDRAHILAFASHEPDLLRAICNRAVLLNAGRIVSAGSVDKVLEDYEKTGRG